MSRPTNKWRFAVAEDADFFIWSYGTIKEIADLYNPCTFGASRNFICECGKLSGEDCVGRLCRHCNVVVTNDALAGRQQRMGKVRLPVSSPHPLDHQHYIDHFLIAPVAFRINGDGSPSVLGRKYEKLLTMPRGEFTDLALVEEVKANLTDIVGTREGLGPSTENLRGLLLSHILTPGSTIICALYRSCGLRIDVDLSL